MPCICMLSSMQSLCVDRLPLQTSQFAGQTHVPVMETHPTLCTPSLIWNMQELRSGYRLTVISLLTRWL